MSLLGHAAIVHCRAPAAGAMREPRPALDALPANMRLPGFLRARHWSGVGAPSRALVLVELESPRVLHSPGYLAGEPPLLLCLKVASLGRAGGTQLLAQPFATPAGQPPALHARLVHRVFPALLARGDAVAVHWLARPRGVSRSRGGDDDPAAHREPELDDLLLVESDSADALPDVAARLDQELQIQGARPARAQRYRLARCLHAATADAAPAPL